MSFAPPPQVGLVGAGATVAQPVNTGGLKPMPTAVAQPVGAPAQPSYPGQHVIVVGSPGGYGAANNPQSFDGLCDCFSECDGQAFWMPWCCPCFSFGELASVHQLRNLWCGASYGVNCFWFGLFSICYSLSQMSSWDARKNRPGSHYTAMGGDRHINSLLWLLGFLGTGALLTQLRGAYIAAKQVREETGCGNCVLSHFCGGCVLCQLMRHTKRFSAPGAQLSPGSGAQMGGMMQPPQYGQPLGGQPMMVAATNVRVVQPQVVPAVQPQAVQPQVVQPQVVQPQQAVSAVPSSAMVVGANRSNGV